MQPFLPGGNPLGDAEPRVGPFPGGKQVFSTDHSVHANTEPPYPGGQVLGTDEFSEFSDGCRGLAPGRQLFLRTPVLAGFGNSAALTPPVTHC